MANITHGMNVAEIKKLGNTLQKTYAQSIDEFVKQIERLVNDTNNTWLGKDGNDFRSWWPAKRAALQAISKDLHGFGQSALNNASEQESTTNR